MFKIVIIFREEILQRVNERVIRKSQDFVDSYAHQLTSRYENLQIDIIKLNGHREKIMESHQELVSYVWNTYVFLVDFLSLSITC